MPHRRSSVEWILTGQIERLFSEQAPESSGLPPGEAEAAVDSAFEQVSRDAPAGVALGERYLMAVLDAGIRGLEQRWGRPCRNERPTLVLLWGTGADASGVAQRVREALSGDDTTSPRPGVVILADPPTRARLREASAMLEEAAGGVAFADGPSLPDVPCVVVELDDASGRLLAGEVADPARTMAESLTSEQLQRADESWAGSPTDEDIESTSTSPDSQELIRGEFPTNVPARAIAVGDVIKGKYRVSRRVGSGGFGTVFEAEDVDLGTRVAIKVLHRSSVSDPRKYRLFEEEARKITRLSHPNIIEWRVFDKEDGVPYFVMELLEGEELDDVIRREGRIEPRRCARILLQILDALRMAHDLGPNESILHLDLKPNNIFLVHGRRSDEDERVKVIDFGIGQLVTPEDPDAAARSEEEPDVHVGDDVEKPYGTLHVSQLTPRAASTSGEGTRLRGSKLEKRSSACTPEYASPEQCAHLLNEPDIVSLDGRSDLYSLGVVAFQMLTGSLPYEAPDDRRDWLRVHGRQRPRSLRAARVKVPSALQEFVDRCLAADREERWASSREAYRFLHDYLHPPAWKLAAKVGGGIALVAGIVVAVVLMTLPHSGVAHALGHVIDGRSQPITELVVGVSQPSFRLLPLAPEGGAAREVTGREALELWLQDAEARAFVHASDVAVGWVQESSPDGAFDAVEVSWPPERLVGRQQFQAVLRSSDSGEEWSQRFECRVLGPQAVPAPVVRIEGREGRSVLGSDHLLHVRFESDAPSLADDVASVQLFVIDPEAHRTRVGAAPLFESGDEFGCTFALTGMTEAQPARFEVDVRDAAGHVKTVPFPPLTEPPLQFVEGPVSLQVTPLGTHWSDGAHWIHVRDLDSFALDVASARPASYELSIADAERQKSLAFEATEEGARTLSIGAALRAFLSDRLAPESTATVEVSVRADERDRVHHEVDRNGTADEVVVLRVTNQTVSFDVWLGGERLSEGVTFLDGDEAVIEVRDPTVAMTLDWVLGAETGQTSVTPRAGTVHSWVVPLGEGRHSFSCVASRTDGPTGEESVPFHATLVRDLSAPNVRLEQVGDVRDGLAPFQPKVGPAGSATGAPVRYSWELQRREAGRGPWIHMGLARLESDECAVDDTVPLSAGEWPWKRSPLQSDGRYRLRCRARDSVGHVGAWTEWKEFEVALAPPSIDLSSVAAEVDESGTDLLVVRAHVEDENGLGEVRGHCTIENRVEQLTFIEGAAGQFEAKLPLEQEWSGVTVSVAISATDSAGHEAPEQARKLELPEIVTRWEAIHLAPRHVPEGFEDTPMRLVTWTDYRYGGRLEDVRVGEVRYDMLVRSLPGGRDAPERARDILDYVADYGYAVDDHADFYLDEAEVTEAQFLRFVEAEDGYRDGVHWAFRARPDGERQEALRARLRKACESRGGRHPVVGVSWYEASAFAAWLGKRLPTAVEWEFAVRGGKEYRLWSSVPVGHVRPHTIRWSTDAGPLKVRQSEEISLHGLYDLCGNVPEWVWSPAVNVTSTKPSERRRFKELLSDPFKGSRAIGGVRGEMERSRTQAVIVGAGYHSRERCHFQVVGSKRPDWTEGIVGFRCAVGRDRVTGLGPGSERRFVRLLEE